MASTRALALADIPALQALRREALATAPWAFAASPEDDVALSREFVEQSLRSPTSVTFGAFLGEELVGMVGVYRDTKQKYRHKAQIWGMYVTPRARHHGLGRALLEAAVEHCRSWPGVTQVQLCVSAKAEAAKRLYERHGFKKWGREPKALLVGDELLDDIHMVRWL
jgi:ribosomal protein S18 acetylase RimI-like enzyme